MKAYVQLVQQREADIGCDVLTHQTVRFRLLPFVIRADSLRYSGLELSTLIRCCVLSPMVSLPPLRWELELPRLNSSTERRIDCECNELIYPCHRRCVPSRERIAGETGVTCERVKVGRDSEPAVSSLNSRSIGANLPGGHSTMAGGSLKLKGDVP